jgi:hypothetical protein
MKRIRIFLRLGIVATLVLALMPVTTALADAPIRITTPEFDNSVDYFDYGFTCGGEPVHIIEHDWGTITLVVHFDKNGQPKLEHDSYLGQAHATLTANGKTVAFKINGPGNIRYNFDGTGIYFSLGTAHLLTLPGYGPVFGSAGQVAGKILWQMGPDGRPIIEFTDPAYKTVGNQDTFNPEAMCKYFFGV